MKPSEVFGDIDPLMFDLLRRFVSKDIFEEYHKKIVININNNDSPKNQGIEYEKENKEI